MVDGINEQIPGNDTLLMIYTMLIKQAFNAYTSFRWGSRYRGDKDSSNDKTNLAFRVNLQGSGTDGSNSKKAKNPTVKKRSVAELLAPQIAGNKL